MVSNSQGTVSSDPAVLTVPSGLAIELVKTNRVGVVGMPLKFSVAVGGGTPLFWLHNGKQLVDDARVHGTFSDSLNLDACRSEDAGTYSIVATNQLGAVTQLVSRITVSSVAAWGDNSVGQTEVPDSLTNIVAIASGGDHSLALRTDGKVVGWGDDSFHQNSVPATARDIVAIADGGAHSLALRADGTVIAWGDNSWGQTNVPTEVTHAVAIAAGEDQSMALLSDGTVAIWGGGPWTNALPATIAGGAIAAGENYSAVISAAGSVQSWGDSAAAHVTNIPALYDSNIAIAAGADFGLALQDKPDSLPVV